MFLKNIILSVYDNDNESLNYIELKLKSAKKPYERYYNRQYGASLSRLKARIREHPEVCAYGVRENGKMYVFQAASENPQAVIIFADSPHLQIFFVYTPDYLEDMAVLREYRRLFPEEYV